VRGPGRGRDDERVDPRPHEGVDGDRPAARHRGRDRRGAVGVGVGDDELVDAVERGERAGVERPDPPGSRESDPHPTSFVRTY